MSKLARSPWIMHYDAASCNGCDIEVLACLTPVYEKVVKQLYEQMPNPKVVVAVGICACNGGVFKDTYNIKGGVDTVIPVDIYVPGCAARPESIIDGVVKAVRLLEEKYENMKAGK